MHAHQFRIQFFVGGKLLTMVQWPDVPRRGETVELRPGLHGRGLPEPFEGVVRRVTWTGDTEMYGRSLDVRVDLAKVPEQPEWERELIDALEMIAPAG